jgi:hypothetical protein
MQKPIAKQPISSRIEVKALTPKERDALNASIKDWARRLMPPDYAERKRNDSEL